MTSFETVQPTSPERPLPPPKREAPRLDVTEPIELSPEDLIEDDEDAVELSPEDLIREPGELQEHDVETAFEIQGFEGLDVAATLEKKDERKGKEKDRNQDNVIVDPETGLLGVLDGLGGEGHGDLASRSAERAIPEAYKTALAETSKRKTNDVVGDIVKHQLARIGEADPMTTLKRKKELTDMVEAVAEKDPAMAKRALALLESFRIANSAVQETGGKTTACVGFIHKTPNGERWAVVANVGDSAAYKRRKNGEMVPLTQEDSLLNTMIASGQISPETLARMKTDPNAKENFPITLELVQAAGAGQKEYDQLIANGTTHLPLSYKKIKAAMVASLGTERSEPSLSIRRLDVGDELLIGTDGLVDKFEDPATEETNLQELSRSTLRGKTQTERLNNLRADAKKRTTYKKDDDIAIVAATVRV